MMKGWLAQKGKLGEKGRKGCPSQSSTGSYYRTGKGYPSQSKGGKGGGGRPDMAQAGGPDGAQGQAALDAIEAALKAMD